MQSNRWATPTPPQPTNGVKRYSGAPSPARQRLALHRREIETLQQRLTQLEAPAKAYADTVAAENAAREALEAVAGALR